MTDVNTPFESQCKKTRLIDTLNYLASSVKVVGLNQRILGKGEGSVQLTSSLG
jgi:hypothetical protein